MHTTDMKSSMGGERKGSHTLKDQYEFLGQVVLEIYLTVELDLTRWSMCEGLVTEDMVGYLRKRRWCVSPGVRKSGWENYNEMLFLFQGVKHGSAARWGGLI